MKLTPAKTLILAGIVAASSFIFTSKLMENRQIMQLKPLKTVEKIVPLKKAKKEDLSAPVRRIMLYVEKEGTGAKQDTVAKQTTAPAPIRKPTLSRARNYLVSKGFEKAGIDSLLADPRIGKVSLEYAKTDTVKGKMTYERYKKYFKPDELMKRGPAFYLSNKEYLDSMETESGVPKSQVLSHHWIESFYGDSTGSRLAVNVLLTRMERNPGRSGFALNELAALLRLCKKYNKDPLEVYGSVWAAITPAQAIPSMLERFDKRHPCTSFDELVSARNSIAFIFDYLMRSGATVKSGYAVPPTHKAAYGKNRQKYSNYLAAFDYNHSEWYARLAMEFALMMEMELVAERLGWPAKTGASMF